jgi:hypothetical protein
MVDFKKPHYYVEFHGVDGTHSQYIGQTKGHVLRWLDYHDHEGASHTVCEMRECTPEEILSWRAEHGDYSLDSDSE